MGDYYQSCPCSITNIDNSSTMKYILLLKISSIFALNFKEAPVNRDVIDMTEEEFLDLFGLTDIDDKEEKGKRRRATDLKDMTEEEFLDFFTPPDIDDQEKKGRRRRATDLKDMTEEEFLDFFTPPDIDDKEEKGKRRRATDLKDMTEEEFLDFFIINVRWSKEIKKFLL